MSSWEPRSIPDKMVSNDGQEKEMIGHTNHNIGTAKSPSTIYEEPVPHCLLSSHCNWDFFTRMCASWPGGGWSKMVCTTASYTVFNSLLVFGSFGNGLGECGWSTTIVCKYLVAVSWRSSDMNGQLNTMLPALKDRWPSQKRSLQQNASHCKQLLNSIRIVFPTFHQQKNHSKLVICFQWITLFLISVWTCWSKDGYHIHIHTCTHHVSEEH